MALTLTASLQLSADNTSTWNSFNEYGAQPTVDLLSGMVRVLWWFTSRLLTTAHWLPLPIYLRQTWELYLGAALCLFLLWLIWRGDGPFATAALATLLGLGPFLLLTEPTILGLPAGPSRYLYLASAGSSLLLASALHYIHRKIHTYAFATLLLCILASSYFSLNQVKAISLYTSGRSYSTRLDIATATSLFKRALLQGPEALPRADLYARLCLLLLPEPGRGAPYLDRATTEFPDHPTIALLGHAVRSMDPVAPDRDQSYTLLRSHSQDAASAELLGKAFYNIAEGLVKEGDMQRAALGYQRSLEFLPDRRRVLEALAETLWGQGQHQQATAVFLRLIQLAPNDPDALYNAALAFNLQGQHRQAVEFCRRALAVEERADARRLLAESENAQNRAPANPQ